MCRNSGSLAQQILVFGLLVTAACVTPATASVSILVDEIHGLPVSADIAEALPQCQITALTEADFPITTVLASGIFWNSSEDLSFTVPPGAEALYARFSFSDVGMQYPFIRLRDPEGYTVAENCYGAIHLENPEPGEYLLQYDSWEIMTTSYEIGTGPDFFTSETVAPYDLVCALWDDSYFLFVGEIPDYSAREEGVLSSYVEGGAGFLYIREPLVDVAVKPIVKLYADTAMQCDVELRFPGTLTFAEPACTTVPEVGYTRFQWRDLTVTPAQPGQILYEGKLARHASWLQVVADDAQLRITNLTDHALAELSLLRCLSADDWRLVRIETLPAGATVEVNDGVRVSRADLARHLEDRLVDGGAKAGLYAAETSEFINHYLWVDRWLAEADDHPATAANWCSLYRISEAAFADFTPLACEPAPRECRRALWVWASGLGADTPPPASPPPPEIPGGLNLAGQMPPGLIYHEYGILRQWGPGASGDPLRSPDFLGWSFHDMAGLLDPVENCGWEECVLFSRQGASPATDEILADGQVVQGLMAGAVYAPENEQVLTGGANCFTFDYIFEPGSYPPVVVARELGAGRLAAVADRDMLEDEADNRQLMANLARWLARVETAAPEVPARSTGLISVAPNPFNPRTVITFGSAQRQEVAITLHDLTGKRVATLTRGSFAVGTHQVIWDGLDATGKALPSGVYMVRLVGGGVQEGRKVVLLR